MSILDTFYILFKTDADQAAKDIKDVDKASDEAAAGLKKVDVAADGVGASFLKMAKQIAAPLLAISTIGSLISVAMDRAAAVRELDQFSVKLNSSISDVDAFQRAIKGIGGETAGALDSLVKIGEKVNEAFSDKESGARKDFKEWGLAFTDAKGTALGASDAMLELAKNLETVSNAEALARIKKLGIKDAATIDLLMMGRATVEEHINSQKRLGVVTEEQAAATRDYYSALGDVQNMLTGIGNKVLSTFLPAMTVVVSAFGRLIGWMTENQTLVSGFFIGIAGVITAVYLPAIMSAAAATIAATWPFLAVGAAIAAVGAAFALAYEDVVAFMDGQPSLIGALLDKYEWLRVAVDAIAEAYQTLKAGGVVAIDALVSAWGTIAQASVTASEAVGAFWSQFRPIWESAKELVGAVGELIGAIGSRIAADLEPVIAGLSTRFNEVKEAASAFFDDLMGDLGPIGDAVNATSEAIRAGFTGAFNAVMAVWNNTIGLIAGKISAIAGQIRGLAASISGGGPAAANDNLAAAGTTIGAMAAGQQALAAASGSSINGQTAGSIAGASSVSNTSNVSVGNVTVNTQATDAKAVAGAVKGELQRQLRGTAAQFDDGVDR